MENKLYRSALWYARHGWQVFPLRPQTKEPFGGLGLYSATTDVQQIWQWWNRWPNANIGLHCGGSGVLALDADEYKDTYAGEKLLTRFDEDTVTNLTGSGGTHLLYAMPEDKVYGNAKAGLPKGIDVRGYGGYIVLPPSIHPNGNAYQWEGGYGPHEIKLLPLPDFLVAILDKAQVTSGQAVNLPDITTEKPNIDEWRLSYSIKRTIQEPPERGGRSEADQSVITALVRLGASDETILAFFQHYPIGTEGKFAEKGGTGLKYLAHSIRKARAFYAIKWAEEVERNASAFMQAAVI
jgi:Bifunctional DNA primase/polymerase, N-terminal